MSDPVLGRPLPPRERANPFYGLSALSMLTGCYLLNHDLIVGRELLSEIASIVGVLQLYEGALLAAAGYLFATRRSLRDARTLLLIEVLFLVDATYFLAEAFEFAPGRAWLLNGVAAGLTALKLVALERGLRLGYRRREALFLVVGFAVLLGLPGLHAAALRDGGMAPSLLASGWWLVAALIAFEPRGLGPLWRAGDRRALEPERIGETVRAALRLALLLSIGAHLRAAHYVYELALHPAALAPLGLGAAYRVLRSPELRASPAGRLALVGLPALALPLAAGAPPELSFVLGGRELGPYRLVLIAGAALALDASIRLRLRLLPAVAAGAALLAALGATPARGAVRMAEAVEWLVAALVRVVPRTAGDWGVVGIVAAFILLGAGVVLTLVRRPPEGRAGGRIQWSGGAPGVK